MSVVLPLVIGGADNCIKLKSLHCFIVMHW